MNIAQIVLLFFLVVVTSSYAWSTKKMVKEMRRQKLTVSQPLVFPNFDQARFPDPGEIWFVNAGNGPALGVKARFAYCAPDVVKREWIKRKGPSYSGLSIATPPWSIVLAGERHLCKPELAERTVGNIGTAFAEYSDIYGRNFLAGWGYQWEKDSNENLILQPTDPIYPVTRERGD